jgi:hypothetical protein
MQVNVLSPTTRPCNSPFLNVYKPHWLLYVLRTSTFRNSFSPQGTFLWFECRAVGSESESEGILGAVPGGVGRNF